MKLLAFIVFGIQSIPIKAIPINVLLVKDYMKLNGISINIFLTCDNITESVNNMFEFRDDNIWMNLWSVSSEKEIQNLNYENILVRLASTLNAVINLECSKSIQLMQEISTRTMFHYERYWLMFGESLEEAYNLLKHQFINMDAEIYLALPTNETNSYRIFEVFNPSASRGGQLNISEIAHWSLGVGFTFITWETKIERRHDLQGLTFHISTAIPAVPKNKTLIEHLESDEFPYMDSGDKNNYRLFEIIKELHNFSLIVHRASVWGILFPNGTWKGVIGMLSRHEVDLSVPAFRWANERYGAFEQTTHTYHIQYIFIFLHPKSVNTSKIYLSPFDNVVWFSIALISFVMSWSLRQTIITESKISVNLSQKIENEDTNSNSILMIFGFLVQQAYYGNPLLISSRILITTVLIFSIVTFQFYSSFLVASLLTEAPKTIKTVQQLLNSKIDYFIDEIAYIRDHIEHYTEDSVIKLYNKITENPHPFIPLEQGIDLIKKGGHAFYTDGNHGYQFLENILTDEETCDLQEVKYVQKVPGGPGVPNKSPFRELIKISLRRISETGLLSYHWKVWIGHKPKCAKESVKVAPVDIQHFSSAILIPIIGIQISLGMLIGEIILSRFFK